MSVQVICKYSKIQFQAATKRTQVHPTIAAWKQEANKRGWYLRFFEAVEYGVEKGFTSIEQFEEVLGLAERNEPFESVKVVQKVAAPLNPVVETLNVAWGYELERCKGSFTKKLSVVDTSIESGYSLLGDRVDITENLTDGIYVDCATGEASSNDIRKARKPRSNYTLFKVGSGKIEVLFNFSGRRLNESLKELEKLWEAAKENGIVDSAEIRLKEKEAEARVKTQATVTFVSRKDFGKQGSIIGYEGKELFILCCEIQNYYEDDDGITHEGYGSSGAVYGWTEYTYYCRPATEAELRTKLEEQQKEERKKQARTKLAEIVRSVTVTNGAVSPDNAPYPKGKEITIRQGYYQANETLVVTNTELWSLLYNGRDGDDWSYNNVAGAWIGCYVPLTPELKRELEEIEETLGLLEAERK